MSIFLVPMHEILDAAMTAEYNDAKIEPHGVFRARMDAFVERSHREMALLDETEDVRSFTVVPPEDLRPLAPFFGRRSIPLLVLILWIRSGGEKQQATQVEKERLIKRLRARLTEAQVVLIVVAKKLGIPPEHWSPLGIQQYLEKT